MNHESITTRAWTLRSRLWKALTVAFVFGSWAHAHPSAQQIEEAWTLARQTLKQRDPSPARKIPDPLPCCHSACCPTG